MAIASMLLCAGACTGKATAESGKAGKAPIATEATAEKKVSDPVAQLYTATIDGQGRVMVTFNTANCEKMCENWHLPFRMGNTPYEVENTGKCTSLLAANLGNSQNPVLIMLTADDKVAMLNIMDAISTGDMTSSGPLAGISDVKALHTVNGIDGSGVTAEGFNGEKTDIEEFSLAAYYYIDDFEIHLTRDWKISMASATANVDLQGTFHTDKATDNANTLRRHITAMMAGNKYVFDLEKNLSTGKTCITLHTGDMLPLISDKPLKCKVEYASQTAN